MMPDFAALLTLWDERDHRHAIRRSYLGQESIWALIAWRRQEADALQDPVDRRRAHHRITADWETQS
jgi:hypothetical protein